MTTTIYGIPNCQTVQKALKWLDDNNVSYTFWNYKKLGIEKAHLEYWCNQSDWTKVLNRSGMIWRKASEETKLLVVDQENAINFMIESPSSIKRPIIENNSEVLIGFNSDEYARIFG